MAVAERVANAATNDFGELIRISGLDPGRDLRFADWSGVEFSGSDVRGFDFTGARLLGCKFHGALIEGARFDQAEIDQARSKVERTNLRLVAKDWDGYLRSWRKRGQRVADDHLPVSAVFQDAPFGPEMVVVPGGSFIMGESPEERKLYDPDGEEVGDNRVNVIGIPRFAVGRFAVTFEEWDVFAADGGRDKFQERDGARGRWKNAENTRGSWDHREGGRGRMPAVNLTWHDAKAYVAWLAHRTGKPYRLLEDTEWEYVARAGTSTPYWWGTTITPSQANYDPAQNPRGTAGTNSGTAAPVDRFEPNPWGLYQVLGNVWEWCDGRPLTKEELDAFNDREAGIAIDPNVVFASIRGGGFPCDASRVRAVTGKDEIALQSGGAMGLRIARTLLP